MKIFNEFRDITEISDALNLVKIIINYAKTASSTGDENLNSFIAKIYTEIRLKNALASLKFNVNKISPEFV
jgi:hypothetical protein